MPYNINAIERFLDNICVDSNGCWIWTASRFSTGYGSYQNIHNYPQKTAHQFSYKYFKGELESGKEIDHLCHNRPCANPDHLEQVTHRVNSQRGEKGNRAYNGLYESLKTHCPKGHEYNKENTYVYRGSRFCRICDRERKKIKYYE